MTKSFTWANNPEKQTNKPAQTQRELLPQAGVPSAAIWILLRTFSSAAETDSKRIFSPHRLKPLRDTHACQKTAQKIHYSSAAMTKSLLRSRCSCAMQAPTPLPQYLHYCQNKRKTNLEDSKYRKTARHELTAHKPSPQVMETTFY